MIHERLGFFSYLHREVLSNPCKDLGFAVATHELLPLRSCSVVSFLTVDVPFCALNDFLLEGCKRELQAGALLFSKCTRTLLLVFILSLPNRAFYSWVRPDLLKPSSSSAPVPC